MVTDSKSIDLFKQWTIFIHKCQSERLSTDRFETFARLLQKKGETAGQEICQFILESQTGLAAIDPLVVSYLKCLLTLRVVTAHELLRALLPYSYSKCKSPKNDFSLKLKPKGRSKLVSFELEDIILHILTQRCVAQEFPKTSNETSKTLVAITRWMNALVDFERETMAQEVPNTFHNSNAETLGYHQAVGGLVVALTSNPQLIHDLSSNTSQDIIKEFGKSLTSFTPVLGTVSIPLANRLEMFQQSHDAFHQINAFRFQGSAGSNNVNVGEIQIENILDRPTTHTKAHLAIYLDSLLSDLPQVNDSVIMANLRSCFKGNNESMAVSLITSGFDLLAMASARGDTSDILFLYRAFLISKIPLLINSIMSLNFHSFVPTDFNMWISQAFERINSHALASIDSGLEMRVDNDLISNTKRDFLISCGLNGLLTDRDVKQLANDSTIKPLPVTGRADRNRIVEECRDSPTRLEQIVKDLETCPGDAGEYVAALVQNLRELCSSRDTMTLKTTCLLLCPRPHAMDMIFLFTDPGSVLGPLSEVLDEWKYDDHQGEYQPVYEEFSACLLFFLACIHRYKLNASHLQLTFQDKFTSQLLDLGVQAKPIPKPNEEQSGQLAGWAKSLFELEVISDDVMSICPPQDFYKLVPTIFAQSFLARRLDILSVKALESGTELLMEPFLLPCMIPGITYLTEHLWKQREHSAVVLPFLTKLIRPSSKSGEALALHNTVLSILKPMLHRILRSVNTVDAAKQKELNQLLEEVGKIEGYSRLRDPLSRAFDSPDQGSGSTVLSYYRSSFDSLCSWSMPGSLMASVPVYSHRDLVGILKLCGAPKVLAATIEALVAYVETGIVDIALDVATAIICTETVVKREIGLPMYPAEMSLRRAVGVARESAAKMLSKEPVRAEVIVLLHRRVEAQLSEVANAEAEQITMNNVDLAAMDMNVGTADVNLDMEMNMNMGMDMMNMDSLNVAQNDAQVAGAGQDISTIDFGASSEALNLSESGLNLELDTSFSAPGGEGSGMIAGTNADDDDEDRRTSVEDIWSGLNFNTDGMDFS